MEQTSTTNGDTPTHDAENETLDPSELGTKEYWDSLYTRELKNHDEDPEDEGTIWFEESNAETVVRKQLDKLRQNGFLRPRRLDSEVDQDGQNEASPSRFLDLGTGNGHMLFSLLDINNDSNSSDEDEEDNDHEKSSPWIYNQMIGIDYSATSIQLARQIASQHGFSTQSKSSLLRFEQWDLLTDLPDPSWLKAGFDVVLDKGTFDAISLMPQNSLSEPHQHPCEVYRRQVTPLLRLGGFLIVTSCNWTRDELIRRLAPAPVENERDRAELEFFDEAAYPTFTFGGRKGQSVVTVVFRKGGRGKVVAADSQPE